MYFSATLEFGRTIDQDLVNLGFKRANRSSEVFVNSFTRAYLGDICMHVTNGQAASEGVLFVLIDQKTTSVREGNMPESAERTKFRSGFGSEMDIWPAMTVIRANSQNFQKLTKLQSFRCQQICERSIHHHRSQ
jgi:hypothetical protein